MSTKEEIIEDIRQDLDSGQLLLPTLPDVAIRARDEAVRDGSSAKDLAAIITTDAALTARLLAVANSPLYRATQEIDTIQVAVTRMGSKVVRNLISSIVMQQLFKSGSPELNKRLHIIWSHSVQVAAISRALAKANRLSGDQAMLAGLIHDIGKLPILMYAENHPALGKNKELLDGIVESLHGDVGRLIVNKWGFSDEWASVVWEHEDITRDTGGPIDYSDIVLAANIQCLDADYVAKNNLMDAPVFKKLGLSEISLDEDKEQDMYKMGVIEEIFL